MEIVSCSESTCSATITIRGKWDGIKASTTGWFRFRDGRAAFCPDHVPSYIKAWRAKARAS